MSNSYRITSKAGVDFGVYQGATPEEAFAAMVLAFVVTFALQVLAGPSAGAATVVGDTALRFR